MSTHTFSRKGRKDSLSSPGSAKRQARPKPDQFDSLIAEASKEDCTDPHSPFFFEEGTAAHKGRAKGSPSAKGSQRAAAKLAAKPPKASGGANPRRATAAEAQGPAAPSKRSSGKSAATSPSSPPQHGQQQAAAISKAKQRLADKPAASLLSHRNSGGSAKAQQQQKAALQPGAVDGIEAAPTSRPSVRGRAASRAARQPEPVAAQAAAAAASAAASKRKGPSAAALAPEPAPTAAAGSQEKPAGQASPAKKMRQQGSCCSGKAADAPIVPAAPAPAEEAAVSAVPLHAPAGTAAVGAGAGATPEAALRGDNQPAGHAAAGAAAAAAARAAGSGSSIAGIQMAALTRLLHPAALREQAAATTVVQAQALGEQQSILDDALWALDGLAAGSAGAARDSLAALAEICATKRGRLALRSANLASDVLAAAGSLRGVQHDSVQALGLATLLLCFCQADADAGLLGRKEVAAAATQLLQLSASLEVAASGGPAAAKLLSVLKERPYSQQLPAEERGSPLALALVALAAVLNPHEAAINAEPLKATLREAGALEAAAQVAADHAAALSDASPTIHTVRCLWRFHKSLLVLENACFACPGNEARLLGASVRTGEPPLVATVGLVGWLAQQLSLLARQPFIAGIKKDCLRALLAVLMNLTQNNAAGCEAVVVAGAPEAVARVLAQLVLGGPKMKGVAAGGAELAVWADELSYCLMLLTNLVEHAPPRRQQLRQLLLRDALGGGGGTLRVVPLLCTLMTAVAPLVQPGAAGSAAGTGPGAGAAGTDAPTVAAGSVPGAGMQRRQSLGSGEVTVDCLEHSDEGGHASIAEAYAAILLGFLIQDCPEARAEAAALLGGTLASVGAAVEGCLHFYLTTGAMTKGSEESLRALLASLRQPLEGAAAGAATPAEQEEEEEEALSPVLG